ncbi:SusC/RagA family TonB-linked outer membrane protein [Capnocytophaga canis]|uniref:TonB-dependent receptor plug n=1 Tax=Capnocytophaga canis TaxID=1848903 RepID=A0A0B7I6P9_9FLAO|nr:SusC/RagA family TonB-linked outer membrane protein [Capnocytophaga canis]CEN46389.1 TonB-dependent receptor plug [Capnocytophaga canis]
MKGKFLKHILIMSLCFFLQGVFAQEKEVSGVVTSSDDGMPIPAVSVIVKGTNRGVATDFDGKYTIKANEGEILQFISLGFTTVEKKVTGGSNTLIINALMKEEANQLEEVVVTGYSVQTRKTLATSISKVDTKVLESASRSNAATALQGTVSGLKVTQHSGQPGTTPDIILRGGTSFDGSGTPLVLVDGVPSSFYALNSDDIESMEMLKDAASTAIYGARAANGVILVTTKKGKAGRSNINFKSKLSFNGRIKDKMEYLNAADYVKFNRMAVRNTQMVQNNANAFSAFLNGQNGAATGNNALNSIYTTMFLDDTNRYLLNHEGWQTIEDPVNPGRHLIFMDNSYLKDQYYQTSFSNDYTLSFDGGNDKSTYYLSLGVLDDKGLVYNTGFKRYSGTFNASYKIFDNFKMSGNVIYTHSSKIDSFDSIYDIFQRATGLAPTSRVYNNNPDGSLSNELQPGTYRGFGNPLYYRDKFVNDNLEQRLTASGQFDWQFAKNFNLMARGSYFSINDVDESFNKAFLNSGNLNTERIAYAGYGRTLRHQYTSVLSYNNTFLEKHNVNALLGTEYFREKRFGLSGSTRKSPTDLIHTLNVGAEAQGKPSSSRTEYAIASVFGQLNYDYDNRFLLGLTFRSDGTSRLANDKYGFFPGASLGWNIHNETFYKDKSISTYISRIKPRVSYGVNGNIETLSNYGVYGLYGTTGIYDTQVGYVNSSLPVMDLRWERSTTLNFGLDLGLFNNRVNVVADYFIRDVQDKLSTLTLPLWTGFSGITVNNGILQNKGFELEVNAKVLKTENLNWDLGLVYYQVKNYAKKLPDNGITNNRQGGTEIYDVASGKNIYVGGLQQGQRIENDLIVAYIPEGVYKTQAEIDADKDRSVEFAWQKKTRFLGDTRWKDVNGDNVINHLDRQVIGRITPKFTGGFTSNLVYNNIGLYVKTDFAVGHHIINGRRVKGIAQTQGNQNGPVEIRESWTPQNPNSDIPRFDLVDRQKNHLAGGGDQGSLHGSSAMYWEKGDYLALREITLSYDLKGSLVKDVLKSARIYVTGANLFYFTAYGGSTPEDASANRADLGVEQGSERGRYPLPRVITLGLNLTF